jgi:hypothetical protein
MYSVNLKKGCAKQNHPSRFDSAESFDPEFFNPELTTEGLVAGWVSLVLDSIKRSAINIRRSMLDVRCSMFKAYSPPLEDSLCRPGRISHKRRRWPENRLNRLRIY